MVGTISATEGHRWVKILAIRGKGLKVQEEVATSKCSKAHTEGSKSNVWDGMM